VEVYEVADVGEARVSATPMSEVTRVRGGPESLLALGDAGVVGDEATVLVDDAGGGVLTDTPRRRETNFAGASSPSSATLGPDDPLRLPKPHRDYASGPAPEAVARIGGVRALSASSSGSDADNPFGADPSAQPFAAVDGTRRTAWRPNPGLEVADQWLRIDFGRSVPLERARLDLVPGSRLRDVVVTAGGRSATTKVGDTDRVRLESPVRAASSLTLRLGERLPGTDPAAPVGVRELSVPGVRVTRTVVLPGAESDVAPRAVVLSASGRRDACVFDGDRPRCVTGRATPGEDAAGVDRTFTTGAQAAYAVHMTAVPVPGERLNRLIAGALGGAPGPGGDGDPRIRATASSVAVPDPAGAATSAVDGDAGTAWIADPSDPDPSITVRWSGRHRITGLRLVLDPGAAATRPTEVAVTSPDGNRLVRVADDGRVDFDPLRTDRLTLHLRAGQLVSSFDPASRRLTHVGLGVSEVVVPGVHGLASPAEVAAARDTVVRRGCGTGPTMRVDGRRLRTAVAATVGQIMRMEPVTVRVCGRDPGVTLGSGIHRLVATPSRTFAADSVVLVRPATNGPVSPGATPSVQPEVWQPAERSVTVGPRTEATLLTVHENVNDGWEATADGHRLRPVTVDGWQQGYVLPPGDTTTVHLGYPPDRWMRWGLGVGALAALVVLAGALLPDRRRTRPSRPTTSRIPAQVGRVVVVAVGLVVLPLVGGWAGVAAAVAGLGVWAVARVSPSVDRSLPWLVAGLYLLAAARLALDPWGSPDYAAGSRLTQWLCLLALALLFAGPLRPGSAGPSGPAVDRDRVG
jgi:arabinofuranan 3-O-arabinosyltransferase